MNIKDLLATCGTWLWFGSTLLVFDPLLRISSIIGEEAFNKTTSTMCHCLCWSIPLGMCHLKIEGQENIPKGGRVIMAANHQSLVESFLPFWYVNDLRPKYIAKNLLGRWIPAVSVVLRCGGHCMIDRGDHQGALDSIGLLGDKVGRQEVSAVIFPEGTRSTTGQISTFKTAGLSSLLTKAPQAQLLPMVVHNGDKVFPKGLPHVKAGTVVTVRFLPVIERTPQKSNQELIAQLREVLQQGLAELEAGSSPS